MDDRKKSKRRKILWVVLILILVVISIRLALPYIILHYANKTLSTMDGYRGHIKDIDLAIIRGAYKIDSLHLNKYDSASNKQTPFFASKTIDLSVEWRSLFKGAIVGELLFESPMLRFTKDKVEPEEVKKDSTDFKQLLEDFMPLKVNRFEVRNGRIQYIDEFAKPPVDVQLSKTNIVALNLRNAYDSSSNTLPALIEAHADVYGGTLDFYMKLNPMADIPTFDMNAEVKETNLVKLNDFFKAYAKVDVNKGTFGLFAEVAAKDGYFDGYVKPLLKDISVLGLEDRKDNVFKKLWEGFVGTVGQAFENIPKEQVATKIPLKGKIKDPKANVWYAIATILQNAFVQAIQPSIDHEINLASVDGPKEEKKGFLENIFDGKDEKKKKKDNEKKKDK